MFRQIGDKVYKIRGQYVLLDIDIIKLYGIEYKYFHSVVAKNIELLENGESEDVMFQITQQEYRDILRSQIVTSRFEKFTKYLPYAFTRIGLSAISGDFNSSKAIKALRQILRYTSDIEKLDLNSEDLRRYAKEYQIK